VNDIIEHTYIIYDKGDNCGNLLKQTSYVEYTPAAHDMSLMCVIIDLLLISLTYAVDLSSVTRHYDIAMVNLTAASSVHFGEYQ